MAFRNSIVRMSQLIADVITGALIQTATSGTRWVIDNFITDDIFGGREYARIRGFTADPQEVDPAWISIYRKVTGPNSELGLTLQGPSDADNPGSISPSGSPMIAMRRLVTGKRPYLEIWSLNDASDPLLDGAIDMRASGMVSLIAVDNMGGSGGLDIGKVGDGLHGAKFHVPVLIPIDSNINRSLTAEGTVHADGALEVDGLAVGTAGYTPDSYIKAPDGEILVQAGGNATVESTAANLNLYAGLDADIVAADDVNIVASGDDVNILAEDLVSIARDAGGNYSELLVGSNIVLSPFGKIDATNETLDLTGGTLDLSGDSISKLRLLSGTVVVPPGSSNATLAIPHGQGNAPTVAVVSVAGVTTYYANISSLTPVNVNVRAVHQDLGTGGANVPVLVIAIWA